MKAAAMNYARPRTLAEAIEMLVDHGEDAKIISGGQSLMPMMNLRLVSPAILIDIGGIDELKSHRVVRDKLVIGALTRHVELQTSPVIAQHAPLLSKAINHVAHPAIRNRGTIGGNLSHADPASELPACMLALDATMVVVGSGGERRIAAVSFFLGTYETALEPNEILVAVEIPVAKPNERCAFLELSRRSGDYAIVGIAAQATFEGAVVTALKLAYFAVGTRAVLAKSAATALIGTSLGNAATAEARSRLPDDLDPQTDLQATPSMRMHLAGVLLERAIAQLSGLEAQPSRLSA